MSCTPCTACNICPLPLSLAFPSSFLPLPPSILPSLHQSPPLSLSLSPNHSGYIGPSQPESTPEGPLMSMYPSQPHCLSSPHRSSATTAPTDSTHCLAQPPPPPYHEAIQEASVTLRPEYSTEYILIIHIIIHIIITVHIRPLSSSQIIEMSLQQTQ